MDSYADFIEGSSAYIKWVHEDQDGLGFQPTTLNVSLYDYKSKTVINSRNDQSLTPIGTYIDANGVVTFHLLPADNQFVDTTARQELHVLRFKTTWSGGTRVFFVEFYFMLKALTNIG